MSLINQMLQDLDGRHATGQEREGLHRDVRSVAAATAPRRRPAPLVWGGLALVAGMGGAAAWLALTGNPAATPTVVAAAPPVAPASAPPAEAAAPVAAPVVAPVGNIDASGTVGAPAAAAPVAQAVAVTPAPGGTASVAAPAPAAVMPPPASTPAALPAPVRPATAEAKAERKAAMPATAPAANGAASALATTAPAVAPKAALPALPLGGEPVRTADTSAAPAPAVPAATLPTKAAPAASGGSEKIEKNLRLATPRDRAEQEYRLAVQSLNAGRVAEALERLRGALRQDPSHVTSRQLLVRLLLEQRAGDEARQTLAEGLEINPGQVSWAVALARLQAERGEVGGALATLQKAAAAGQDYADYQGLYGNLLARQNHPREAAERYLAAARLNPGEGRWWLGLGLALEADGRGGEAKDAFARARSAGNLPPDLAALAEQRLR